MTAGPIGGSRNEDPVGGEAIKSWSALEGFLEVEALKAREKGERQRGPGREGCVKNGKKMSKPEEGPSPWARVADRGRNK